MENINNWTEVSKGFYRYVIGANVAYEIHIIYRNLDEDIYKAKARLYLVGDWYDKNIKENIFERECLVMFGTLDSCIRYAIEDYKTMS